MKPTYWEGRRVFITGHTGFKGSWLSLCLSRAGAVVSGYALAPPTDPSLFVSAEVRALLANGSEGDVRDARALSAALRAARPEVVFHLAAQPLVRYSYRNPTDTYAVNVMGTVNLYEAVRAAPDVRVVVNVTTDKCYENREWAWGYREVDALGGYDPYSSSKACSELVAAAYRQSFLVANDVRSATARAGNVIGGGDWAPDRLVPDFFRAAFVRRTLEVRNPKATRPWQHVLEPVFGYMLLAEQLAASDGQARAEAWNFGPSDADFQPVGSLLDQLVARTPHSAWQHTGGEQPHEAGLLKLDSSKAHSRLGWATRWSLPQALDRTAQWYGAWRNGSDMRSFSMDQIDAYLASGPA